MRTDSTTLSETAITAARAQARELYGARLPAGRARASTPARSRTPRRRTRRSAPPATASAPRPRRRGLPGDEFRLYELIWMRTVASQMKDAVGQSVTVRVGGARPRAGRDAEFSASGKVITFHGFLKAYVEGADDPNAELRRPRAPAAAAGRGRRRWPRSRLDAAEPRDQAAGPLHRGDAGQGAGGPGDRPPVDVRVDHRHHPGPRLRVQEGHRAGPVLPGLRRGQAAGEALRPAGRLRVHRADGGRPRPDRPRRGRAGAVAAPLLLRRRRRRRRPRARA